MKLIHRIYRAAIKNAVIITAAVFPVVVQAVTINEVRGYYFIGKNTNPSFSDVQGRDGALDISVPRNTIERENFLLIKGPGEKIVTLTNESGNTFQLNIRPRTYISFNTPDGNGTAWHEARRAGIGCAAAQSSAGLTSFGFYSNNIADLHCTIPDTEDLSSSRLIYDRITFTLKHSQTVTPPTAPGLYRGTVSYSVGPTSDVSFGPSAEYNFATIEVPITVEVTDMEHRITFPPGSDLAVLIPSGGWAHWINSGVRPDSISREIPFTISSAGTVTVSLAECSYLSGTSCQIANDSGDLATLALNITLPEPWRRSNGNAPVTNLAITTRTTIASQVYTQYQVARNSPGKLKIEVKGAELDKMLAQPGSTWTGNVTVVFDKDAYD